MSHFTENPPAATVSHEVVTGETADTAAVVSFGDIIRSLDIQGEFGVELLLLPPAAGSGNLIRTTSATRLLGVFWGHRRCWRSWTLEFTQGKKVSLYWLSLVCSQNTPGSVNRRGFWRVWNIATQDNDNAHRQDGRTEDHRWKKNDPAVQGRSEETQFAHWP